MKKWLLAALYAAVLVIALIYRSDIVNYMQKHGSFPVLVCLSALVALFPVIPYKLVIAALGFSFGTFWAAAVSWLGTMITGSVIYALSRTVLREQARTYLNKFGMLQSFTAWVEAHPFMSVAAGRLIPVLPQMAVNVFAGVARSLFGRIRPLPASANFPAFWFMRFWAAMGPNTRSSPSSCSRVTCCCLD
ncbi:SNARE associated Golgi protein [Paenibacillus sp. P1XP2]|nr:SNARE associated Golgi protein [Paenibacillus sp. P1XP2]